MWEVIDFECVAVDLGCCIKTYDYYKVKNIETEEVLVLSGYEYYKFKYLNLIK